MFISYNYIKTCLKNIRIQQNDYIIEIKSMQLFNILLVIQKASKLL